MCVKNFNELREKIQIICKMFRKIAFRVYNQFANPQNFTREV